MSSPHQFNNFVTEVLPHVMKIVPVFPLPVSGSAESSLPPLQLVNRIFWTKLSLSVLNFSVWARKFSRHLLNTFRISWLCLPSSQWIWMLLWQLGSLQWGSMRFPENEVGWWRSSTRLKLVGSQPKDWRISI